VLNTTSMILSHHQMIEKKQSEYYMFLAEKYPQNVELFIQGANENLKHMDMAQRAYREGVTDAFEVGFLANTLDPNNYTLMKPNGDLDKSINIMIANEETIIRFCEDAVKNSSKLLPDVLSTFERIVKRKKRNIEKLRKLK